MDTIELKSACVLGRERSTSGHTRSGNYFCPLTALVEPEKSIVQGALVVNEDEHNVTLSDWKATPLRGSEYWNARFMYCRPEDPRQTEALVTAAMTGDLERVNALLDAGAWANHCDANGGTPLHFAAYYGHAEVVRVLLDGQADPAVKTNAQDLTEISYVIRRTTAQETGDTPLHLAAANGHTEVIRILLEAGADSKARNARYQTPCDLAKARNLDAAIDVFASVQDAGVQDKGSPRTPVKVAHDRHGMSFSLASATTATPDSTMWSEATLGKGAIRDPILASNASAELQMEGLLKQAGFRNMDHLSLLLLVVETQCTRVLDAWGLSETFAFGTCPSVDKAACSTELIQMAARVASTGVNYTCILLTGCVSERPAPSPNCKDGFVDFKAVLQDLPQDAPARALCQALQGACPRARLIFEQPSSAKSERPSEFGADSAGVSAMSFPATDIISHGAPTGEPVMPVRVKHRRRCAAGHKLISEPNEFYGDGICCDGCQVRICSASTHRCRACSFNLCDACYARGDVGKATEHCHPGQLYEAIHQLNMRGGEDLSSRQLWKIPAGSRLSVLQIGVGIEGKRIRVSDEKGHVGWISVVDSCNRPLVQLVEVARPTGV
mmetsp:Transcript_154687/g.284939  ORF Transcript_154687/g.284939 Transcript_154687/m.284939 type:complete len:612 (+) Transcript_154687:47-1882(+)